MLSSSKITKKPNKETTQVIPVQERSGLYLIVEPKPSKCKRFEGRMRYPRGRSGKTQYILMFLIMILKISCPFASQKEYFMKFILPLKIKNKNVEGLVKIN